VKVKLNPALIEEEEKEAVNKVLDSGQLKGGGQYDEKCQEFLESELDIPYSLMTTSCTHALEMAALLLEIDEGDEVIIPSYTFPSTATAFALRGAKIVFAEIKPDTLNIDPKDIRDKISEDTAAIVPVHYAGVGCDMESIMEIAEENNIDVVEDAAQAINSFYKGKQLGTIGDIGCYSFHETKNFVAGEGGAITVQTKELYERSEILRQKGTDYEKFRRGEVENYTWRDLGSSYVPSELQTAVAYEQLKKADEIVTKREKNYQKYREELESLEKDGYITLPTIPEDRDSNYHLFYILTRNKEERDEIEEKLRDKGIEAYSHYQPLHTSEMGRKYDYNEGDLPITEKTSKTILRLPVHRKVSKT
jgi:dTDP-4-amino-4,6-dideoxygalactose transaminase